MAELKLTGKLSLLIEPADKKLRLVISDEGSELACRKESRGKLKRFLSSAETSIFKGRLQLHKNNNTVAVILKGEDVGVIRLAELEKALN
ncbi:hypothetical protein IDJ77_09830 [Mucilaginibacter sp. ZT4R22]|uniref:Uncharacterized protein n=1 Tax=Mucilaginibacter pankratovii TaxID=2772110 RepID=A0ABR7WP95_9SPHI|nr:hypothetical protein [Mucilaginibacter pankratovii]MBD1364107.1 hypothetical protein [Mucilaginibacter pankratovii]